jgi:uncharacterized caspase-like protein/uncharacterized protein YecT (DUF1311 family)
MTRVLVLAILLALLSGAWPAAAERRVALVIGNSAYANVPRLPNPENDARAIEQSLSGLGFAPIVLARNQTANELRATIQSFAREAANADLALVFYAGHGVEYGGSNYLIPVDAQLRADVDVEFEAIPLDLVLRAIAAARVLRVVILDACRDNPFANRMTAMAGGQRNIGRGLARVDPAGGTLVAYAARAGAVAADGTGANSPFTTALLQHLPEPVDIRLMFGRVRDTVAALTNNQQEPFLYGSIGGREVYLKPSPSSPPESVSRAPPPVPAFDARAIELSYWESVRSSNSAALIRSYLERYPNGIFAPLAQARINDLEQRRVAALPPAAAATLVPRRLEQPSISCEKPDEPLEELICADAELAAWDGRLGRAYRRRLDAAMNKDEVRMAQREWIARRYFQCNVPRKGQWSLSELIRVKPCVLEMSKSRVVELGGD